VTLAADHEKGTWDREMSQEVLVLNSDFEPL